MSLEKDLNEFRDITIELMDRIEYQGNRLFLIKKREDILVKIKESNYDTVELKNMCEELKIYELDKILQKKILDKMECLKQDIKSLKISHQGNQAYLSSRYGLGSVYSRFDKRY